MDEGGDGRTFLAVMQVVRRELFSLRQLPQPRADAPGDAEEQKCEGMY